MKKYYIAYGSNLNVFQMSYRCPDAEIAGIGEIKDYELLFKGSKTGSYLTIEKKEGGTVPVAVWEVSSTDKKNLDRYEGYPNFYYKKDMKIKFKPKNGRSRTVTAFVYIMHEERAPGIPTPDYLDTCLKGYNFFRFNDDLLWKAIRRSEVK